MLLAPAWSKSNHAIYLHQSEPSHNILTLISGIPWLPEAELTNIERAQGLHAAVFQTLVFHRKSCGSARPYDIVSATADARMASDILHE